MAAETVGDAAIAQRLRRARERRGWSREELAVESGVSWSAISQIESGRRPNPRSQTLAALARPLGVSVEYLVGIREPATAMLRHQALMYRTPEDLVQTAGPLLAEGIEQGDAGLAVTSKANLELLREHLGADAGRVRFADSADWYSNPVAAVSAYREFATQSLRSGVPWIRVIGEPVWEGLAQPQVRVWARYESLINLVFAGFPVTLVCPYDETSLDPAIVHHARATHCETVSRGGAETSPDYRDPSEFCLSD